MSAREEILRQIRSSLKITGDRGGPVSRKLAERQPEKARTESPLEGFIRRCEQTQAVIHRVAGLHEAVRSIHGLFNSKEVRRVVLWDHPLTRSVMEELGRDRDVEWVVWNPSRNEDQRSEGQGKTRLSQMDLGLSAADFALADTGSLVLVASEGHDPLVSILPPIHVALVAEDQILEGIEVLLEQVNRTESLRPASFNLISGPSRTGDIELTMSLGVHGPREVHVILGKSF